jgi:hypothetical protein
VLTLNLCGYALEQIIGWKYGLVGVVALGLVGIGHRAKNTMCTAIGLAALALLLAQ